MKTFALECPQKRGERLPRGRCAWQNRAWLTTRRPKELAMTSVFLRLPETGRARLEDNQAQKKGHDGACTQAWHVVMDMEVYKAEFEDFLAQA